MTSFTHIWNKEIMALYILGNKGIGNLARYLEKTYCVRKSKKLDAENLIIVALQLLIQRETISFVVPRISIFSVTMSIN